MQTGPLRRLVGAVGLIALVPTALLLIGGDITAVDAAVRALVTMLGVVVIGRATGAFLDRQARRLEAVPSEETVPRRRTGDREPQAR